MAGPPLRHGPEPVPNPRELALGELAKPSVMVEGLFERTVKVWLSSRQTTSGGLTWWITSKLFGYS
jgi:hypothetical protein